MRARGFWVAELGWRVSSEEGAPGPREGLHRDAQRPRMPERGLVLQKESALPACPCPGLCTWETLNPGDSQRPCGAGLRAAPGPRAHPQGWAPRAWFGLTGPARGLRSPVCCTGGESPSPRAVLGPKLTWVCVIQSWTAPPEELSDLVMVPANLT